MSLIMSLFFTILIKKKSVSFLSTHIWIGQKDLQGFVLAEDAMCCNLPQEGLQGSTVDLPLS